MKVIRKGKTADGIDIQIEDWSENYPFFAYGSHLVAYPKTRFRRIRTELNCSDNSEANRIFELLNGFDDLISFGFTAKSMGRDVPFMETLRYDDVL